MLTIKENTGKVFENFDKTNFQQLFLDEEFIRFIAVNGKEFLQALYFNGKFQFAAALIEYGMQASVADFIHAMNNPNQTELLARLTELQVRNISNNILNHFAPLEKYWLDYITPQVGKILSNNLLGCQEEEIDVSGQVVQEL